MGISSSTLAQKFENLRRIVVVGSEVIAEQGFRTFLYLAIQRISRNANYLKVPTLSLLPEEEENILEGKMVWIFGSPRSGTTWLGIQLLDHRDNIIWHEPYIGYHLAISKLSLRNVPEYFFSSHHKKIWLPLLRKLILLRTYSHTQTLRKNVIIKEPNGSAGADIIMECLPNSKLIFLLRDGRDVVESFIDAHRPDSWNKQLSKKPLLSEESRHEAIRMYSQNWKRNIETTWKAYKNHNPNLRLLVRYGDMRQDTFPELKKIYNFLNIRISDDELRRIIERYDFKNIPDSEKGPGKFNRSATTGGWRTSFNKEEQELMNSIMQEMLREFGYQV